MIIDKSSIEFISKELNLPYSGDEQDWDLEMANYKRLYDFISFYSEKLTINQKKALMSLILASFNDLLNEVGMSDDYWDKIRSVLVSENEIFKDLFVYWGASGESGTNNDDNYEITSLLRSTIDNRDKSS
jgi:hypothetical protein